MRIAVSDVAVDFLMDALTDKIFSVLTNIGVGVLVDVNANVLACVMTALDLAMPGQLEEFRC